MPLSADFGKFQAGKRSNVLGSCAQCADGARIRRIIRGSEPPSVWPRLLHGLAAGKGAGAGVPAERAAMRPER